MIWDCCPSPCILFVILGKFQKKEMPSLSKSFRVVLIVVIESWHNDVVVENDGFLLDACFMPPLCIEVM